MSAYGWQRDGANRCPTHLDSVPKPVALVKGTPDWLSQLAVRSALRLRKVGLPGLIASVRGEPDIHSAVGTLSHEASPLLDQMGLKGTPVKIERPTLTPKQIAAAIAYGSQNLFDRDPSFLRTEMRDFLEKGFWIVLPLEDAVGLNGFCLSPVGLIPQRDRRDRIVIDYTWSGVNKATHRLAPDSMQFCGAMQLILQRMYDADPCHGPIYMTKVDTADFFCVGLAPGDVHFLGVCLSLGPDGKTLVAFLLVLPMGWVESPPQFCAVTETVAEIPSSPF